MDATFHPPHQTLLYGGPQSQRASTACKGLGHQDGLSRNHNISWHLSQSLDRAAVRNGMNPLTPSHRVSKLGCGGWRFYHLYPREEVGVRVSPLQDEARSPCAENPLSPTDDRRIRMIPSRLESKRTIYGRCIYR